MLTCHSTTLHGIVQHLLHGMAQLSCARQAGRTNLVMAHPQMGVGQQLAQLPLPSHPSAKQLVVTQVRCLNCTRPAAVWSCAAVDTQMLSYAAGGKGRCASQQGRTACVYFPKGMALLNWCDTVYTSTGEHTDQCCSFRRLHIGTRALWAAASQQTPGGHCMAACALVNQIQTCLPLFTFRGCCCRGVGLWA